MASKERKGRKRPEEAALSASVDLRRLDYLHFEPLFQANVQAVQFSLVRFGLVWFSSFACLALLMAVAGLELEVEVGQSRAGAEVGVRVGVRVQFGLKLSPSSDSDSNSSLG